MSKQIYIVTGGAGFIGSHLVERLIRDGHSVRVVDNLATGSMNNLAHLPSGSYEFFETSIADLAALREIFKGADIVFHEAALPSVPRSIDDPLSAHEANIAGTLNVLIAAKERQIKRVVYAASSAAYGDAEGDPKTEAILPRPLSPYAVGKLAGEYYCQAFAQVYGLETVALRYFNVFGPRQDETSQYAAVIPKFAAVMLSGKAPTIYGDGTQSRDFTYVEDVVHGNLLAAAAPNAAGKTMNLATGVSVNLLDLVSIMNRVLGTTFTPVFEPARTGDVKHSRAAIDRAVELLNFHPAVDFETGLARTLEWFKGHLIARGSHHP